MRNVKRTKAHNAKIGAALRARGVGASPTKLCPRCKRDLPRTLFGTRPNGHTKTYCPPCDREFGAERQRRHLEKYPELRPIRQATNRKVKLKQYDMTIADYDRMLEAQGGRCIICRRLPTRSRRSLDVDHCHETGVVRGLLCSHCNRCIGLMADDPARLRAAADYLEGAHQERG